jgi:hypothetical protein
MIRDFGVKVAIGARISPRPPQRTARSDRRSAHSNGLHHLDELGYLPFAQSGGQFLFHLVSRLYERTSIGRSPDDSDAIVMSLSEGAGCGGASNKAIGRRVAAWAIASCDVMLPDTFFGRRSGQKNPT